MSKAGGIKPLTPLSFPKPLIVSVIAILIVLVTLSVGIYLYIILSPIPESAIPVVEGQNNSLIVTEVIDGDTFKLSNGDIVRLACIDAPEKGSSGYEESKIYLDYLIRDETLILENTSQIQDDYGRLVKFAYLNSSLSGILFINKHLIETGKANFWNYSEECNIL